MGKAKLSICIPTFNRAKILNTTLRNLLSQNLRGVEIIISDNASTDNTKFIVSELNSNKIKYFRNKYNMGPVINLFKSMECASGDFFVILSDEDDLYIDKILDNIKTVEKKNIEVAAILGSINSNSNRFSYKDKLINPGVLSLRLYGYRRDYISGIVLNSRFVDLRKYMIEAKKKHDGTLGVFPHTTILNEFMVNYSVLTTSTVFCSTRDIGPHDHSNIDLGHSWVHPLGRIMQFRSEITFISKDDILSPFLTRLFFKAYRYRVNLGYIAGFMNEYKSGKYNHYLDIGKIYNEKNDENTYSYYRSQLKNELYRYIEKRYSFEFIILHILEMIISAFTYYRFKIYLNSY